ncbi:MAG TPA: response regulator [Methylomirabilota bacterium]|nr:response regulator [Methylomirabilota bacterium]
MTAGLQIVIIEDNEQDVFRIEHELSRAGVRHVIRRVETENEFHHALRHSPPDLILSDHGLPSFCGRQALIIALRECPEVPFIFVTGSFELRTVVETIEMGAAGYVFKNRLSELVPAIREAFEAIEERDRARLAPPVQTIVREAENSSAAAPMAEGPQAPATLCPECERIWAADGLREGLIAHLRRCRQATIELCECPDCERSRSGSC